jgi:hypothetical protein
MPLPYVCTARCSMCRRDGVPYVVSPEGVVPGSVTCLSCRYRRLNEHYLPMGDDPKAARFALGPVLWGPGIRRTLPATVARGLVGRHAEGDWGTVGQLADTSFTDEDREAGPLLLDTARLNSIAIATGRGEIRSAFPRKGGEPIHVRTCLDLPRTVVFQNRPADLAHLVN